MRIFSIIIFALPVLNFFWWWWADLKLRKVKHGPWWRGAVALFALFEIITFVYMMTSRMTNARMFDSPLLWSPAYLWHLLVLPISVSMILAWETFRGAAYLYRQMRRRSPAARPVAADESDNSQNEAIRVSRRRFLSTTAAVTPVAVTAGLTIISIPQLRKVAIRRLEVPLSSLPLPLDGLRIAHLSDTHVGTFSKGAVLKEIADKTNALKADFIVLTGDLINARLADLPAAIEMLKQIDPRGGVVLCEGNHDLFEDRAAFENGVRDAGFKLLLNETHEVVARSQRLQFLGLKWGRPMTRRGAMISEHLKDTLATSDPSAFRILLAHHPHAFDNARTESIPLTLAGHTHGGQLMLTENVGVGPELFKYWSGLYGDRQTSLVVSNGAGNWFPLRINAPAEIVEVVLRRA